MRPLRYSINVTLDGCCDHRAILAAGGRLAQALGRCHRAALVLMLSAERRRLDAHESCRIACAWKTTSLRGIP